MLMLGPDRLGLSDTGPDRVGLSEVGPDRAEFSEVGPDESPRRVFARELDGSVTLGPDVP